MRVHFILVENRLAGAFGHTEQTLVHVAKGWSSEKHSCVAHHSSLYLSAQRVTAALADEFATKLK